MKKVIFLPPLTAASSSSVVLAGCRPGTCCSTAPRPWPIRARRTARRPPSCRPRRPATTLVQLALPGARPVSSTSSPRAQLPRSSLGATNMSAPPPAATSTCHLLKIWSNGICSTSIFRSGKAALGIPDELGQCVFLSAAGLIGVPERDGARWAFRSLGRCWSLSRCRSLSGRGCCGGAAGRQREAGEHQHRQ